MTDTSLSTLSYHGDSMAKRYLEMNAIKGAFVHKEGPRHYQVLEGNPSELMGFVCGEFQRQNQRTA
jgi:hypothetical protein